MVEFRHREAALKLLYSGPMLSELKWRDTGEEPVDSHEGIKRAIRVAEALARAEDAGEGKWKALRQWCSLVPGFRAVTVDAESLVACDMDEQNGASKLIEAPDAHALCAKLGLANEERAQKGGAK